MTKATGSYGSSKGKKKQSSSGLMFSSDPRAGKCLHAARLRPACPHHGEFMVQML